MSVETTVGAADANSWADESEFKEFRVNRFPVVAAVVAATDDLITPALIVACRMIGDDFKWTGRPVNSVQALTWPRRGMRTRNGYPIASTDIPIELKYAQCEMAYELLAGADLVSDNDALLKGISSIRAGSVGITFQNVSQSTVEEVDMFLRRMGSDFNYLSSQISGEVRRLLVPSWFEQPTIKRPLFVFAAGSGGLGRGRGRC